MGTVNRLRLMPGASHVCATWADTGHVPPAQTKAVSVAPQRAALAS